LSHLDHARAVRMATDDGGAKVCEASRNNRAQVSRSIDTDLHKGSGLPEGMKAAWEAAFALARKGTPTLYVRLPAGLGNAR
jgi:hypothetical protein